MNAGPTSLLALRSAVPGTLQITIRDFGDRTAVVARTSTDQRGGALSRRGGDNLAAAADAAMRLRLPLVLELASSGADVSEGIDALHGWGGAAAAIARCSGSVPVLAVVDGAVVSGPALMLGLADLVVMTPDAMAFVSGPSMVSEFTGVRVDAEQLGGVATHAGTSGVCAVETDQPEDAVSDLLSYLPGHTDEEPPRELSGDPADRQVPELRTVVPSRASASYDVRDVARALADDGLFTELWARWAPQMVTALARVDGRPVGVVANQPRALAGTLDIVASQKAARFVRFCDAFNLPILTLVDTPGFLPGKDLEWRGMIRHGAELAFAYAEATVPRLCVILRKAYGGAYIVMDSKGLGNDMCWAWPGAEVAVMGASGAVQILHRSVGPDERKGIEDRYQAQFLTPWAASERGFVDEVIDPADTRKMISAALRVLCSKRETLVGRKHDGGPL